MPSKWMDYPMELIHTVAHINYASPKYGQISLNLESTLFSKWSLHFLRHVPHCHDTSAATLSCLKMDSFLPLQLMGVYLLEEPHHNDEGLPRLQYSK